MKVKAKAVGYYGGALREVGESLTLTDEKHFSKSWMEKVEKPKAEKPKAEKPTE